MKPLRSQTSRETRSLYHVLGLPQGFTDRLLRSPSILVTRQNYLNYLNMLICRSSGFRHPVEEANFSHLCLQLYSFLVHYPQIMAIGEDRNVGLSDLSVNLQFHSRSTSSAAAIYIHAFMQFLNCLSSSRSQGAGASSTARAVRLYQLLLCGLHCGVKHTPSLVLLHLI